MENVLTNEGGLNSYFKGLSMEQNFAELFNQAFSADNPLSCSPEEEEATTSRDEDDGQHLVINQMEDPGEGSQDSPRLSRADEWSSMESDARDKAESLDHINNNQDPVEEVNFQDGGLLLTPEDDLMSEVVQLLNFKQINIPFGVNYGESATFENNVGIEGTSEIEEFPVPRDQTENENREPLDDARYAIQEPEDDNKEAVTVCSDFETDERGLCLQSEESDTDSDGGRDTLEMHLAKQKMNTGRESSGTDQEEHEEEILNANNGNDVDKIPIVLDKPEPLNEKGCTRANREVCMGSRLPFNCTSGINVHSSDRIDHIDKVALTNESRVPAAQVLEQEVNEDQEYYRMDLDTEEPLCKGEVETMTVSNLEIRSFDYERAFIVKADFDQGDHLDLHPEQESNQYSRTSIMPVGIEVHYEVPRAVSFHDLEEQVKEPIVYEEGDHIQMKHNGLFPKEEKAYMKYDETDEEAEEVCSTRSSNLATEKTAMGRESAVIKIAPEPDLAEMLYSEKCFHQDRDEEQQESSETEDDLNLEADKQPWKTDLVQQELWFHGASSSHQLEEDSLEEDYNNEVNKEGIRDTHLQTDSPAKYSDDQDSKEDSDEERRRHDIADKLDPEVLHLLEMHLLKQQLVVIKEEQEEEPGFDDLHINEQKEHLEAFIGSRKFTPPLDMVLEEPEPVEENEQTVGASKELNFKDVILLEQDLDKGNRSSELDYREMGWVAPIELSIKTRSTDITREHLDNVAQESLWQGLSTEEIRPFTEEFENREKDEETLDEEEFTGGLYSQMRSGYKQHVMVCAPEVTDTTPKYSLEERTYKLTQIKKGLDKIMNTNFPLKEEKRVPLGEELTSENSFSIYSVRKLESEGFGELEVTFECEHSICAGQSTKDSPESKEETNSEILIIDEKVKKCFGVTTTSSIESDSENWKNQIVEPDEGTELLGSNMEPTNLFGVHILESPYSSERDHSYPREGRGPKDLTSQSDSRGSLEGEDQQAMVEISATASSITTYKDLKERQAAETEGLEPPPGNSALKSIIPVEKPLGKELGDQEVDLRDQLSDAVEKAKSSERRASQLQVEVEHLQQEIRNLRQENIELLLLSEHRRCQLERGTVRVEETQIEATKEPIEAQRVPESVVLKETEERQTTGNKGAEQLARLRREFDFVRQESHSVVEQLTSLQQQLRTLRQVNRKPSSIIRGLVRTSLVAALGILLFWWGMDQLG